METIDYSQVSFEQLQAWHLARQRQLYQTSNGKIQEPFTFCPIENELRYEHNYIRIGHVLTHSTGDSTLEIIVNEPNKRFHLAFIGVHDRRKGIGTRVMTLLTILADKYGYMMDLEITDKYGVDLRTLHRFYQGFGFERHPLIKGNYRVREVKSQKK